MTLRDRDGASIRAYLDANADLLTGRVLDYGSGRQPYRDIVESAGGAYVPFDSPDFPASLAELREPLPRGRFDACIITQIVQYLPDPVATLTTVRNLMLIDAPLLMTGPTNWPLVERLDLWRFTPAGITLVLERAGFSEIEAEERETFAAEADRRWALGFQVKARA